MIDRTQRPFHLWSRWRVAKVSNNFSNRSDSSIERVQRSIHTDPHSLRFSALRPRIWSNSVESLNDRPEIERQIRLVSLCFFTSSFTSLRLSFEEFSAQHRWTSVQRSSSRRRTASWTTLVLSSSSREEILFRYSKINSKSFDVRSPKEKSSVFNEPVSIEFFDEFVTKLRFSIGIADDSNRLPTKFDPKAAKRKQSKNRKSMRNRIFLSLNRKPDV